jgi:hypothetical protein
MGKPPLNGIDYSIGPTFGQDFARMYHEDVTELTTKAFICYVESNFEKHSKEYNNPNKS